MRTGCGLSVCRLWGAGGVEMALDHQALQEKGGGRASCHKPARAMATPAVQSGREAFEGMGRVPGAT